MAPARPFRRYAMEDLRLGHISQLGSRPPLSKPDAKVCLVTPVAESETAEFLENATAIRHVAADQVAYR